jgi:SPP1 family predicted phage head-tail adaptor
MIGKLKHQILIQKAIHKTNEDGNTDTIFQDLKTISAKLEPLNFKECFYAMGKQVHLSHRVTIRFIEGIYAGMRVCFQNRPLTIKAVLNPSEASKYLILLCEEVN